MSDKKRDFELFQVYSFKRMETKPSLCMCEHKLVADRIVGYLREKQRHSI